MKPVHRSSLDRVAPRPVAPARRSALGLARCPGFGLRPPSLLVLLVLLAASQLSCGGEPPPPQAAKPPPPAGALNVLFITSDDLGPQLGAYGETLIETPRIDRLAAGGTAFDVAYSVQASCSPARAAMLTGLHAYRAGQYGLLNSGYDVHPELRDRSLPNLLGAAGYHTGIVGKLHVAPESSFHFDFDERGYREHEIGRVAELADRFLDEAPSDRPFFLMVNYADPHVGRTPDGKTLIFFDQVEGVPSDPLPPSEKTILPFQQIDTEEVRVRTAGYYNSVRRLDVGVGLLMDSLEEHGHAEDTLIVFVGDHGPPFSRAKVTVYEAGVRIPFIVRWPGVSKPMKSQAMVSTVDVLPTVLDAAGLEMPSGLHGKSLRSVVSDPAAPWREYLVAEFTFHTRAMFYPQRSIRNDRFKLIHNLAAGRATSRADVDGDVAFGLSQTAAFDGTDAQLAFRRFADPPEIELYDLRADPVEFHDLAGRPEYRAIERELSDALLAYREQTGDPLLDPDRVTAMLEYSDYVKPVRPQPWWKRLLPGGS